MDKTRKANTSLVVIIILILIGIAGLLAYVIYKSIERDYEKTDIEDGIIGEDGDQPAKNCQLMVNEQGEVGCFGCSSGKEGPAICKDPAPGYKPYQRPEGYIGIPYSCYEGPEGCMLAQ